MEKVTRAPIDEAKYLMCSKFSFSEEEFKKIKAGYERPESMDYRWYISTSEDNIVSILRSWNPAVVYKIPFEKRGSNFVSETSFTLFNITDKNLESEISKQNYQNYWIYSLISYLIFDEPPIFDFETLVYDTKIDFNSVHGFKHWRTVYRTGLELFPNVDKEVLFYFSIFHDFFRQNDYHDIEHGNRAVEVLKKQQLPLTENQLNLLYFALKYHDLNPEEFNKLDIALKDEYTIQACIDSDRLDLGRVGITPSEEFLLTKQAKIYLKDSK